MAHWTITAAVPSRDRRCSARRKRALCSHGCGGDRSDRARPGAAHRPAADGRRVRHRAAARGAARRQGRQPGRRAGATGCAGGADRGGGRRPSRHVDPAAGAARRHRRQQSGAARHHRAAGRRGRRAAGTHAARGRARQFAGSGRPPGPVELAVGHRRHRLHSAAAAGRHRFGSRPTRAAAGTAGGGRRRARPAGSGRSAGGAGRAAGRCHRSVDHRGHRNHHGGTGLRVGRPSAERRPGAGRAGGSRRGRPADVAWRQRAFRVRRRGSGGSHRRR